MIQNREFVTLRGDAYEAIISRPSESERDSNQFQLNTAIAPCPSCNSTRINVVAMPQHCTHHAARRCAGCDRFLSWEPKPANQQKRQRQQEMIGQLLKSPGLSQWELRFLSEVKGKKLSLKQREILEQIETKVGGLR